MSARPRSIAWSPGAAGPLLAQDDRWEDRAACRNVDPAVFFPPAGGVPAKARRICAACPVRAVCLGYALEHRLMDGVWGGTSERQRRDILGARKREPRASLCVSGRHPKNGPGRCAECRSEYEQSRNGTRVRDQAAVYARRAARARGQEVAA
jgi:WhiB family redox-sensing transcriptional regulator